MKRTYWFIFLCIASFFSCSENNNKIVLVAKSAKNVNNKVEIDTLEIAIDNTGLDFYRIFTIDSKKIEFIAYNRHTHAIEIYSFNNRKRINNFKLEKQGPNGINSIQAIEKISDNVLAILTDLYIVFYNTTEEKIEKSIRINNSEFNKYFVGKYIFVDNHSKFYYDNLSNTLFFSIINVNKGLSTYKGESYDIPIVGFYSITNDEFGFYDEIRFPKEYVDNYFGFNDKSFFEFSGSNIYYNFSGISKVFSYNKNEMLNLEYQIEDIDLPFLQTTPLSWNDINNNDKKFKHYIRSSNFSNFLTLTNYKVLFYYSSLPEHVKSFNDLSKKELLLILFSKEFEFIKNINMPTSINLNESFSIEDKIYVPFSDLEKENSLLFLTIDIEN